MSQSSQVDSGKEISTVSGRDLKHDKDIDQAYFHLKNNADAALESNDVNLSRLRRKIDFRIVPLLFLCYFFQILDKSALNYSAIMGLNRDLKLQGNQFSNAASFVWVSYLAAQAVTGFILNKVPVATYLGVNVILWGISTAATAGVQSYGGLVATRVLLGLFEACHAPCLILISSQWYTKSEQAPRFAFWFCGLGAAQILGGVFSYAFQGVVGAQLASWRILFLALGIATIVTGSAVVLFMPNAPIHAKWLSDTEKTALLRHVEVNRTGQVNYTFKIGHIWEIFRDPQCYLLVLMMMNLSIATAITSVYSAQILGTYYNPRRAALMTCPTGAVGIVSILTAGFGVRYFSHRWFWISACCLFGVAGGAIMAFTGVRDRTGQTLGIYLIGGISGNAPLAYQWIGANLAGSTKRPLFNAIAAASFSVGSLIGPQTFQARDRPYFTPAKIGVMSTQGAAAVVATVLFGYYYMTNKSRDRKFGSVEQQTANVDEAEKWLNLTDRENKSFRYVY